MSSIYKEENKVKIEIQVTWIYVKKDHTVSKVRWRMEVSQDPAVVEEKEEWPPIAGEESEQWGMPKEKERKLFKKLDVTNRAKC